jgi:hypothetical protein
MQASVLPELEKSLASFDAMREAQAASVESWVGAIALQCFTWMHHTYSMVQEASDVPEALAGRHKGRFAKALITILRSAVKWSLILLLLVLIVLGLPTTVDRALTADKAAIAVQVVAILLSLCLLCSLTVLAAILIWLVLCPHKSRGSVVPVVGSRVAAMTQDEDPSHASVHTHAQDAIVPFSHSVHREHSSLDSGLAEEGRLLLKSSTPEKLRIMGGGNLIPRMAGLQSFTHDSKPGSNALLESKLHISCCGRFLQQVEWQGCEDHRVMAFFRALRDAERQAAVAQMRVDVDLVEGEVVAPAVKPHRSLPVRQTNDGRLGPCCEQV